MESLKIGNVIKITGTTFYVEAEREVSQQGIEFDCDGRRYRYTIQPHDYLGIAKRLILVDENLPNGGHPLVCYGLSQQGQVDNCIERFDGSPQRDLTPSQHMLCSAVRDGHLDALCDELPTVTETLTIEPWQKSDMGYTLDMPRSEKSQS